jgi:hypothetical protein
MEDIKKNIIYYDYYRYDFDLKYPKIKSVVFDDSTTDLTESIVTINDNQFVYNIIGRFDKSTNIWEWSWVNEDIKNKFYYIRELFHYGIDTDNNNLKLFKNILVNSKIKINNNINLDIILAVTAGFLYSYGFKYIYPIKENENIIKYLILKPIKNK